MTVIRSGIFYKIVTKNAIVLWDLDLFTMYALYEDDTEAVVEDRDDLKKLLEQGVEIGVEVGSY